MIHRVFAKSNDLAASKFAVDQVDIDKLKNVPVYWSKLTNVVKNDIVKKSEYHELV